MRFFFVAVLMVAASLSEALSIGAIIPFINLISSRDNFFSGINLSVFAPLIPKDAISLDALLIYFSGVFCIAVVVAAILRLLLLRATTSIAFLVGAEISSDIFRKTLYSPYQLQISRNTSQVISSVTTKSDAVIYGTLLPALNILSGIFIMIAIIIALFYVSPSMTGVIFAGFSSIYLLVFFLSKKRLKEDGIKISHESSNLVKILQEGLGGVRDILIDGTQEIFCQIYSSADNRLRKAQAAGVFIGQSPRFLVEMIGTLLLIGIAYMCVRYQTSGSISSIAFLGMVALGAQRLLPILQQIFSSLSSIQSNNASLNDVLELLSQPSLIRSDPPKELLPFDRKIEFVDLSFAYGSDSELVLKNINFSINRGDHVGVIGKTGEGKSTLVDLLLGLLEPTAGFISIDHIALDSLNCRQWQSRIAHVPQNIFLADTTVAENIAFSVPKALIDMERVIRAAKLACISSDIERWDLGYRTVIGERGIRLSGGQRQRVGIARALYKNCDVLVLDEATSALDIETEQEVMTAINQLNKDITIILIAHRLSTLASCNLILEVSGGSVISKVGPKLS